VLRIRETARNIGANNSNQPGKRFFEGDKAFSKTLKYYKCRKKRFPG
jgi:hypothetical protein